MSDISVSLRGTPSSPPPPIVEISPPNIARRRLANWGAVQADAVRVTRRETFEYGFRDRRHLLVVYERAERDEIPAFLPPGLLMPIVLAFIVNWGYKSCSRRGIRAH